MNAARHIRQKILVVLAMILMVTAYGLPASLHLKICISEDGYLDITTLACASEQKIPVSKRSNPDRNDHHGKCTDFTTACDGKKICNPTSLLFFRNPSSKIVQLMPIAKASGIIPLPDVKHSFFPPYSSKVSFSFPACLSSVVILI